MGLNVEARLYRLVIALSLLAAIGFGIPAVAAALDQANYHKLVLSVYDQQHEECVNKNLCNGSRWKYYENRPPYWARADNEAAARFSFYLGGAIVIPAGLFLLFFGGRWIMTG